MPSSTTSKVMGLGGGLCVFGGSMVALPLHLLGDLAIACPLGLVTGLSIWRFWPGGSSATKSDLDELQRSLDTMKNSTVPSREVVEAIALGTRKLDRILMEAANIRSPNTIRRIKHLDATGRKIIEDFRQDPEDVRRATAWLGTYLDQTLDCVKQYALLSRNGARSLDAQRQMTEFDDLLDLLQKKSEELLDSLLNNDTTNMNVNMSVLRDMLNNEGIKS